MHAEAQPFTPPTAVERIFSRMFGWRVGLGLGLQHNYLLEVRGRKTGRLYATPVNLLCREDRRFLVAPRGYTQWVQNAVAQGELTLKKGSRRKMFRLRVVPDAEKLPILQAYLRSFTPTVRRYFPVPPEASLDTFAPLASRYPVFELLRPGQLARAS
ncbi:MAG TPA: nitroreductase/quinone reductase family protein [Candidatus Sulfotelmatobacter sp.]|nr:nitroreductase/quinone reductase family protein [Candidatus Sulfotelmatobacter sp.]